MNVRPEDDDPPLARVEGELLRLAVLLCLFVGVVVALLGLSSSQAARDRESRERAEALAQSLAGQVSRALALGIPFDRLRGVEAVFEHALQEVDGVQRVVLADARRVPVRQASAPSTAAPRPGVQLVSAQAAISRKDAEGREQVSGFIVVETRPSDAQAAAWETSLLLLAVASIAALSATELWRWKLRRGPGLRAQVIRRARHLMADGDWTALPDAVPAPRHQGWIHAHGARVRALVERYQRIRRLTASLASTEPDPAERSRQEQLHEQACGLDRFPDKRPARVLVSSAWHDLRLVCFLMLAASEGMRFGAGRVPMTSAAWLVVVYAIGAMAGRWLAARLAGSSVAGRMGSAPALVMQAMALVAGGWLVVALSHAEPAVWIGRGLSSLGVGMVLALAHAFCAGQHEADGREAARIEGAIARAGEWLGPLLGFVLVALAGLAAAWLLFALTLAAGVCVCLVLLRQAPWPLDWGQHLHRPAQAHHGWRLAAAQAALGALLAWLAGQTAWGIAHDSLTPAALWLAYGACIGLAHAFSRRPLHRFTAPSLPLALGAAAAAALLAHAVHAA